MRFPGTLFFLLFVLTCIYHLTACGRDRQLSRRWSKVLLMPLLALAYAFGSRQVQPLVLIALCLGWAGDVLLIRPTVQSRQFAGIGCFAVGHVCYILAILKTLSGTTLNLPWLPPLFSLCAAVFCFFRVKPVMDKAMHGTGFCYFLILAALITCAGFSLFSGAPSGRWLYLGSLLFLFSDTVLCYQFFTVGSPAPKYDVLVMASYLLAQTALMFGFLH